jgi:hypothetical protein
MQDSVSNNMFPFQVQQPDYRVMISDLMSLIERIRLCQQIASDSLGCEEAEDNVIILNDVTPQDSVRYNALDDCCLQLREALHFMLAARSAGEAQRSYPVQQRSAAAR